jgi:hypothetical protein
MKHVPPPTGMPVDGPEVTQEEISCRLAVQERQRVKTHRRIQKLRERAFLEIERLIAFLDACDPYVTTELEEDDDREEGGDAEPSLGSFDRAFNQEKSYRQAADTAGDTDAEQDDCDDEPALGSLDHNHSQEEWATGDRRDLEQDGGESGIGDRDGLLEQVGSQDWQHGGMV